MKRADFNWITRELLCACKLALLRRELTERQEGLVLDAGTRFDRKIKLPCFVKSNFLAKRLYFILVMAGRTHHAKAALNNIAGIYHNSAQYTKAKRIYEFMLKRYGPTAVVYGNLAAIEACLNTREGYAAALELLGTAESLIPEWKRLYPQETHLPFTLLQMRDKIQRQLDDWDALEDQAMSAAH